MNVYKRNDGGYGLIEPQTTGGASLAARAAPRRLAREEDGLEGPPPITPGPHWGAVRDHGIPRPREWDATGVAEGPALRADELDFVVLPDRTLLVEEDGDAGPLANAIEATLARRTGSGRAARGVKLFAVAANAIRVEELPDRLTGDLIELTVGPEGRILVVDGRPAFGSAPSRAARRRGRRVRRSRDQARRAVLAGGGDASLARLPGAASAVAEPTRYPSADANAEPRPPGESASRRRGAADDGSSGRRPTSCRSSRSSSRSPTTSSPARPSTSASGSTAARTSTTSPSRRSRQSRRLLQAQDRRVALPVQLMGGIVLHEGDIAEMKTGEQTFVAVQALYLNRAPGPRGASRDGQRLPREARLRLDAAGVGRARHAASTHRT